MRGGMYNAGGSTSQCAYETFGLVSRSHIFASCSIALRLRLWTMSNSRELVFDNSLFFRSTNTSNTRLRFRLLDSECTRYANLTKIHGICELPLIGENT